LGVASVWLLIFLLLSSRREESVYLQFQDFASPIPIPENGRRETIGGQQMVFSCLLRRRELFPADLTVLPKLPE
jgi:hypothetical protein